MLFEFQTTTDLANERDAIFRYIVDLRNWSRFPGWGPLPGIAEATLPDGGTLRLGARVRVRNTDGSVHHEVVTRFDPPSEYAVTMELAGPAAFVMKTIEEEVQLVPSVSGSRLMRTFRIVPRSIFTAPAAFLVRLFLRKAVLAHNENARRDLEVLSAKR